MRLRDDIDELGRVTSTSIVVATLLLIAFSASAHAQAVGIGQPLESRKDTSRLDLRDALPAPVQSSPSSQAPTFKWRPHPTLTAGPLEIAVRARVQLDVRDSDAPFDEDGASLLGDIPRKRFGVEGRLRGVLDFQIERELGDDTDAWRDVYVNFSRYREIQFQVGKFKVPFGMDENTSAARLDFAYRSLLANTLAPGRDRGFMVHGELLNRLVGYQLGRFDHDGRNARPRSSDRVYAGQTVAGRISAAPLRPLKANVDDLELGVTWTSGDVEEGYSGIRGQTVFGETFYSSDYYVLGRRRRMGVESRWRPGPFSVQWEYSKLTDERQGLSVEDTDLSQLRARGWYLSGTWAVTGDRKSDGLEATKHPLFQGGIGAVEIAARIERLTFDSLAVDDGSLPSTSVRADRIVGNSNRVLTLGVNWYLNQWIRVQFNVIRETLTDPEQGPAPDLPDIWSRVLKVQFTL